MAKAARGIRRVPAPGAVVLVCRKCSRRLDGGFGAEGDQRLAKVLRRALRDHADRRARSRVIEVGCLDVCPKDAVVALRGDRPGDWLVVPRGTRAAAVGEALGLLHGSASGER